MAGLPEIILSELRGFRLEANNRLDALHNKVGLNTERIAKVESKVSTIIPRVESACAKANGASEKIASVTGQWSTGWKIAASVIVAAIVGVGGWLLGALV